MTMSNNDMAALFPDVIQCMMIPALEIKKMYAILRSVAILAPPPPLPLPEAFMRFTVSEDQGWADCILRIAGASCSS
jgi:hypothetical protein